MSTAAQVDPDPTEPIPRPEAPSERTSETEQPNGRRQTLAAAPIPKRAPGAGFLGMILAVLLIVLGLLALYDGIVLTGWVDGAEPLLTPLITGPAVVGAHALSAIVGALVALLGLWLLLTALSPSGRSGIAMGEGTGVWMSHADLERIVRGTAEDCDGVLSAECRVSRRSVEVVARTTTPEVEETLRGDLRDRLAALSPAPKVVVRTEPTFADRDGGAR